MSELTDSYFPVFGSSTEDLEECLVIQHLHFMVESTEVHELNVISFYVPALLWDVFKDLLMKTVLFGICR